MSIKKAAVAGTVGLLVRLAATALIAQSGSLSGTFTNWIDHPAIAYTSRPANDPVSQLKRDMQAGRVHLTSDGPSGYLRSVLDALHVPVESQIVVFAPDSVQAPRISMGNPRSLFFNDSVSVGWVRGGFIELASQDPQQGVIFYALERSFAGTPALTRRNDCLTCHYSYSTVGVPGMLVRSSGQFAVDHTLPIEKRWGGWYVTGSTGTMTHLGNAGLGQFLAVPPSPGTLNWPSFDGKFDVSGYLSTHSDVVALLVFEHQMHLMNLLTRLGWEARVAESRSEVQATKSDGSRIMPIALEAGAAEVVDYMLFIDEAPLADTVRGSAGFRERFEALGPFDRQKRSLRQLDLRRRVMRYPCSYLIYSPLFDGLPGAAKNAVYRRLWQVLSGVVNGPKYQKLSLGDRRAVVDILRDTKLDLPPYFQSPSR